MSDDLIVQSQDTENTDPMAGLPILTRVKKRFNQARKEFEALAAHIRRTVFGDAGIDAFLIGSSIWEILVNLGKWAFGFVGAGFLLMASAVVFAGKSESQQSGDEIEELVTTNECLQNVLDGLKCGSKTVSEAKQEILLRFAESSPKKIKTDLFSAFASAGSIGLTATSFSAQPLFWMVALGWVIWPITAVIVGVAIGLLAYRAYKYRQLQKVIEQEEKIEADLLTELKKKGVDVSVSLDQVACQEGSANEKVFKNLGKDKFAAVITSLVFGSLISAGLYAILLSYTAIMVVFPPVAIIIGLVAVAIAASLPFIKLFVSKIKATATHCFNRIKQLCGHAPENEPKAGFTASTWIRSIGVGLGLLSLVTIPIVGWAIALGVGLGLCLFSFISTVFISKRETHRQRIVEDVKVSLGSIGKKQVDKGLSVANELEKGLKPDIAQQQLELTEGRSTDDSPAASSALMPGGTPPGGVISHGAYVAGVFMHHSKSDSALELAPHSEPALKKSASESDVILKETPGKEDETGEGEGGGITKPKE